jgi:AAHS family 4-hydroxybenzoate transporter-like MFS transporter
MTQQHVLDVDTLIEGQPLGRLQYVIVFWLCAFMMIEGYNMQVVPFSASSIIREWHLTKASFGPVISATVIGYMIGSILLGTLGDRLGRKQVIIGGALIFGLSALAAAFAENLTQLLSLRVLAGIGLGGAVSTGIALAAEYTPHRMRATVIGFMYVGYTVGASLGGFLSAALIPAFGWRSVFVVGGLLPLPLCLGLAIVLPESIRLLALKGGSHERVGAIARRLRPARDFSGVSSYTAEKTFHSGSLVGELFRDGRAPVTLFLWCASIASFTGHYFLTGWLPTVLSDSGYSISQANIAQGLLQAGGTIGSVLVGLMLDRFGMKVVFFAFLAATPAVISLGVINHSIALLFVMVTISGMCVFGGRTALNAVSAIIYPTAMRGTGAGWVLGIGRIGSMIGPIVGGILITQGVSRQSLFSLSSMPLLLAGLIMFFLSLRLRGGRLSEVQATRLENNPDSSEQPAK